MANETVTVIGNRIPRASFKISDLRAALGSGLARPNLFQAELSVKSSLLARLALGKSLDNFKFRCERAELPGRTVATVEDAVGAGPSLKLPYDVTYNDIQLSIICAEDFAERTLFEAWIDFIVIPAGNEGAGTLRFYNEYAQGNKLTVDQLDSKGLILCSYTMYDVYPIALTPMSATWEEINTYQRFGVTLAYRYYTYSSEFAFLL